MGGFRSFSVAVALAASTAPAWGEPVHGRLQVQSIYAREGADSITSLVDARERHDVLGDLRLTWKPRWKGWSVDVAYRIAFDAGDMPLLEDLDEAVLGFLPSPPATWWDLSDRIVDERHFTLEQRADRLSVTYTGTHFVVRAGRQALTWGAGLVFHPMDLFNPFAPDATDTEYKPGTDMIYGQYLFGDGSDLQLLAVPRAARAGGGLTMDASSFALHYRRAIGALQTTWLVSRDHGDIAAGLGLAGALGQAIWNAEIVPTFVKDGGVHVSALANISNAGRLLDRDITYFVEYYRNGFGTPERQAVIDLDPALVERLLRGQTFNIARDYLSAGAQVQWTPLLTISPTVIANLNDGSLYVLAQATYSLGDNLSLITGAQVPIGPADSEFGGVPIIADSPLFLEQPTRIHVQLRHYF